jgi:RHH-type rel operon transcriptional repressor/antitoxin RelB
MAHPLSVRLDPKLEARLDRLAKRTGRTKTFYVREAIAAQIEDLEDAYLAERVADRVARGQEDTVSLGELQREFEAGR